MAETCSSIDLSGNDAASDVSGFISGIKGDIRSWASNANSALGDLAGALSNLGRRADPHYNFRVYTNSHIGDFSAPLPELGNITPWTPTWVPAYAGPVSVGPVTIPNAPTPPNVNLSFNADSIDTPSSINGMTRPTWREYAPIQYTDPGQRPHGGVGTVAPYNAPDPFDPDLAPLNLTSAVKPASLTLADVTTAFPPRPATPEPTFSGPVEINVHQPAAIQWQDIGQRPDWTGAATPSFDFTGEPGAFAGAPMPDAPVLATVTMPTYSGPDDPVPPVLDDITIPTIRDVVLPEMDVAITQEAIPTLTGGLDYTDPGYSDAQVDTLRTEISRVLNGDLGIPAHLWDAVWDKAVHQITRQGVARERQGRQAWAKLGWNMPGGIALAQQEQAAHDINQQLSEQAREKAVQRAMMEREDFWQAVQHGVAFQTMMQNLYNTFQERQLRAQVALVEAMVNIYNANVSRYNAQLQRAQAEIAIKELELRGALSQLEVDKGKMEGARIEAEVQGQVVQTYTAKWEGVRAAVQKYKTEVEAKQAELDIQRLRVQTYGEEVRARAIEVDAWAKEWDGYVAKVEGQKAKAQVYEAEAKVFSERMRGFGISSDAEKSRIDALVRSEQLQLDKSKTEIENFRAKWSGLESGLNAELRAIDQRLQAYATEVQAKSTQAQTEIENQRLKASLYDAEVRGYSAEVSGIGAKAQAIATLYSAEAERYRADTQGAVAEVDASAKRVQAQAQAVDANARAYSAAVDGERARTEGQKAAADIALQRYQTEAQVNKVSVDADVARYEGEVRLEEAKMRGEELQLRAQEAEVRSQVEAYRAQIAGHEAGLRASIASVEAQAKAIDASRAVTDAQSTVYETHGRMEAARIGAEAQIETAKASYANAVSSWGESKARVEVAASEVDVKAAELDQRGMIEEARLQLQYMLSITETQTKGLEALGQMYSQLVAGAYSAANISASISSQFSESQSNSSGCNESHNFSYESTGS